MRKTFNIFTLASCRTSWNATKSLETPRNIRITRTALPRSGCVPKPRVGASATLGYRIELPIQPQRGCGAGATRSGLRKCALAYPGLKQPWALGHNRFAVTEPHIIFESCTSNLNPPFFRFCFRIASLRCCFMTSRRLLLSHILGVAIGTIARLLKLLELLLNGCNLRIGRLLVVLMTGDACSDRDIRSQTAKRAGSGDVDMAGRAFTHVFTLAALVTEHH